MTLNEFKAWFEGFTEAMDGAPSADQWAKIKAKLDQVRAAEPLNIPVGPIKRGGPWWESPAMGHQTAFTVGYPNLSSDVSFNESQKAARNTPINAI